MHLNAHYPALGLLFTQDYVSRRWVFSGRWQCLCLYYFVFTYHALYNLYVHALASTFDVLPSYFANCTWQQVSQFEVWKNLAVHIKKQALEKYSTGFAKKEIMIFPLFCNHDSWKVLLLDLVSASMCKSCFMFFHAVPGDTWTFTMLGKLILLSQLLACRVASWP